MDVADTFRNESMCGGEWGVLRIVWCRVGYQIFEEEQVTRGALYDCEKPIAQLELPAAGVSFLLSEEGGKSGIILQWIISAGISARVWSEVCGESGWGRGEGAEG